MTIDGPRMFCLSLEGTHEKEISGDGELPESISFAPYVGRFGWVNVDLDALDPEIARDIIVSAWRRTAPKAIVAGYDGRTR